MRILIVIILMFLTALAHGQTHTMSGTNNVPSGASLILQSGSTTDFNSGATVDFTGATVTGLAAGGTGDVVGPSAGVVTNQIAVFDGTTGKLIKGALGTGIVTVVSGVLTNITDNSSLWDTAYTDRMKWDGGATGLTAATGRTSLGLDIGVNVQAYDADLDGWAAKTPYAGTVTVTTGKTFNATGTLTYAGTDGSTLNIGTGGTLGTAAYTASTAYQTADADLTTWAGITPVAAVGTWIATPSSANLRSSVTDENGTGALLFSGATSPDFTTGLTVGAAAASGKILQGNGTVYTASTPTWPTTAGTTGYLVRSDGTNFASYPNQQTNSSITNLSVSTSDIYLAGSSCVVAAGDFKAGGQYRCVFDMVKSAGTGAIVITVRIGTAGTTGDTSRLTFTFGSGTSVADSGVFDVVVNWRSVGSGTSAVVQGICRGTHNLATTGLFNNAAGFVIIGTPSGGFNSSTATTIGLSFTGATAFAGTNSLVQSQLQQ